MKRRTKLLLGTLPVLAVGAGIAAWLVWFPPWATSLERRLLGAWDGTGEVLGDWSFDVKPDPEHGVPGGEASGRMTSACMVQAEFKPDGTYTWNEQHQGQGASKGMSFSFSVPKEGGEPARWEVVRARGSQLTVRIHCGDVVFDFRGEDGFTMDLSKSTKESGTHTFHRSAKAKN
jgi:hypothetical protein